MGGIKFPPPLLDMLTTHDLIASGACRCEVLEFRDKHFPGETQVPTFACLEKTDDEQVVYIGIASGRYGYGDGFWYGDGYAHWYGDGYGYGQGYGHGSGYGDGSGYGYGDGSGYGDRRGHGAGNNGGDGRG